MDAERLATADFKIHNVVAGMVVIVLNVHCR
jgi:hypothetical protein